MKEGKHCITYIHAYTLFNLKFNVAKEASIFMDLYKLMMIWVALKYMYCMFQELKVAILLFAPLTYQKINNVGKCFYFTHIIAAF